MDYHANETQTVFDPDDVRRIEVVKAETMLEREDRDGSHLRAAIREFGATHCIAHQSTAGVFWGCQMYLGQTNTLRMLMEDPDLIRCLSDRLLEMSIESVRFLSEVGLDLFYIDDAMGTSDMISPALYEQFSLPYLQAITAEIHRLGRKAVVIYFGGVSDRLELIASSGADGLLVETSMKNYTNDIVQIAERIGDRISLFGNIDPIGVLEQGTDEELEAEIQRQALAARKTRGFIMSTGSPITPLTPLARVQQYIRLAQQSSA
jgi:uroporphyrinogen decarboxylase